MELEAVDRRILARLQRDARLTNQQLAAEVGLSTSACWRRVKALEESGVILRYAALVDRARAGLGLSAIVHVSLERHEAENVERFVRAVQRHPDILDSFQTTGDADYHLRVVAKDIEAYNRFLDEFLFRLPGIRQVRTNIVLKDIKADVALPMER